MHGLLHAHVRLDPADAAPGRARRGRSRRRAQAENTVLARGARRRGARPRRPSSPSPCGYCSVTITGTPSSACTREQAAGGAAPPSRTPRRPGGSASWTSMTTSAARSRSSTRAGLTAASCGRHRERALPEGHGPGGDREQDLAAQRAGRQRSSSPSGSRSRTPPPPTRRRGRRARGWRARRPRSAGAGRPKSPPPAVMRSTSTPSGSAPGQHKVGVERGEGGLQAGRAHRRLLEGHLLLVARVRGVVGGDAVDRARRAGPRSAPGGRTRCAAAGSSSGACPAGGRPRR